MNLEEVDRLVEKIADKNTCIYARVKGEYSLRNINTFNNPEFTDVLHKMIQSDQLPVVVQEGNNISIFSTEFVPNDKLETNS